jgi:hypothetical protein
MQFLYIFIGGFIGFISAIGKDWLIENKKQKNKKQEFKKEKLEEIYILIYKIFKSSIDPTIKSLNIEYDDAKLSMLIKFYFPNLEEQFNKYIQVVSNINLNKIQNFDKQINKIDEELFKNLYFQYKTFISYLKIENQKLI